MIAGRQNAQQTFWRQLAAPTTKVVLATAAPPPSECKGPDAGDMAQMLLMSKQDYARWHSYELHVSTVVSSGVRLFLPKQGHKLILWVLKVGASDWEATRGCSGAVLRQKDTAAEVRQMFSVR